jgi:hypothetical protein
METAETARAKRETCSVVYAEGTVIRLGEGRLGIYVDTDFKDDVAPLLGRRVRILIIGLAKQEDRRRAHRSAGSGP